MESTVLSGAASSSLLFNGVFEGLYGDSLSCSFDVFFLEVISIVLFFDDFFGDGFSAISTLDYSSTYPTVYCSWYIGGLFVTFVFDS